AKRFNLRARNAPLGADFFRLDESSPGIGNGDFTLFHLGKGTFERELCQFRIQFEQHITGLDAITFINRELGDEPGDRGGQHRRAWRSNGAGYVDLPDDGAIRGGVDLHRDFSSSVSGDENGGEQNNGTTTVWHGHPCLLPGGNPEHVSSL
ncbi:MAG TPA: hypothetical protein VJ993_04910, partial [Woeseiaceae bacterium]|nr:hypothetical protein [Woeseiaceae bacterium]